MKRLISKLMLSIIFLILLSSKFLLSQVNQEWVARYVEPSNSRDEAFSTVTDVYGNVYVTGFSNGFGTNFDYITVKYNTDGVLRWWTRYDGPDSSADFAHSIAVDISGNVYVTGSSQSASNFDLATIKYNSDGVQQWVARYNDVRTNGFVEASAFITVDESGNVYVASSNNNFGGEYVTMKYNSAGVQKWVAIYNGPGNHLDQVRSIAVDVSGNVYVTGESHTGNDYYSSDYATIKYDSAGIEKWVARYNGVGNSLDQARSIATDGSGNVYVTGQSAGTNYATIKYNSAGDSVWVARYDGMGLGGWANSIAVDVLGNVYVTGWSNGVGMNADYATIKYNSDGVQQWAAIYNGPGNFFDEAKSIAIDGSGNVYVTGRNTASSGDHRDWDYATIKYNSTGIQQWVSTYSGPGISGDRAWSIAIDVSGNVYVTGESYIYDNPPQFWDLPTVKYNSDGVQQWAVIYNGPIYSDQANALVIDNSGNVYVTGRSEGGLTMGGDYATVKYNSSGIQQWASRYNGGGNSQDEACSIDLDSAGNVYVTGTSRTSAYDPKFATIKYNSAGVEEWVAKYGGESRSVAVDNSGNVYVTGRSNGYITIKYNTSGVQQWIARYDPTNRGIDGAYSIALDDSGNVYVTGESYGSNWDFATVKYSSTGVMQWVARYSGPGNSSDEANSIVVDDAGNIYVTGSSSGDYATIKYNSAGVQQYVARYNGPGDRNDIPYSIAVDRSGNAYVTGFSTIFNNSNLWDYTTIKYNIEGEEEWVSSYNGTGNSGDQASSIVVDNSGNVYVTGFSLGLTGSTDYATIKYNATGIQQWVERYNGPGNLADGATSIALDVSGNVFVTGYSYDLSTNYDYATIKYSQQINNNLPLTSILPHPDGDGTLNQVAKYIYARDTVYKPLDCGTNQLVIMEPCDPWVLTFYVAFWIQDPGRVKIQDLLYNWDTTECQDIRFDFVHPHGYDSSMYSDSIVLKVTMIPHEIDSCNHNTPPYVCVNIPYYLVYPNCWRSCLNERITFTAVDSSIVPNVVICSIEFDKPLPVELASFTSAVSGNNVILNWTTSTEKNNKGFTLQRGTESIWKDIGFFDGKGNSTSPADYSFTDRNLNSGLYNYRLKQIDFNGNIEYLNLSNQVVIGTPDKFTLSQNYPNPFNPTTKIVYGIPRDGFVSLRIYDMNGREIRTLVNEPKTSGYYTITFNAKDLSSGVYFYKLESGNFISAKKFVFIK